MNITSSASATGPEIPGISVLSVTYAGESPENLRRFFASLAAQTRPADEIVLVRDGELGPDLQGVIEEWQGRLPLLLLSQPKSGLAVGLNLGLGQCGQPIIMRCDTDDVSHPQRFAALAGALMTSASAVASGPIREHWEDGHQRYRTVPAGRVANSSLSTFFRSPVNHNNCCYRRDRVLAVGGYPAGRMEDFRLWSRLFAEGETIFNLQDVLLDASAHGLNNRRGGAAYITAEFSLLAINARRLFPFGALLATAAMLVRVAMRVELLSPLRAWLYRRVLRRGNGAGTQ